MPKELFEAAFLASRAMVDLPENKAVFAGKRQRMEAAFRVMFENMPGKILLAKDANKIVGVMRFVEWPKCTPTLKGNLQLLPAMLFALKGTLFRSMKMQTVWANRDPNEHHWHFGPFAVLPERQGQGIGSFMVEYFCKYVDSQVSASYLETGTMDNVRFYQRFGFSVMGEVPIYDVPTWLMWRPKPDTI